MDCSSIKQTCSDIHRFLCGDTQSAVLLEEFSNEESLPPQETPMPSATVYSPTTEDYFESLTILDAAWFITNEEKTAHKIVTLLKAGFNKQVRFKKSEDQIRFIATVCWSIQTIPKEYWQDRNEDISKWLKTLSLTNGAAAATCLSLNRKTPDEVHAIVEPFLRSNSRKRKAQVLLKSAIPPLVPLFIAKDLKTIYASEKKNN